MAGSARVASVVALVFTTLFGLACGERVDDGSQFLSTHPADIGALRGMLSSVSVQGQPLNWNTSVDPCGKPTCSPSDAEADGCNWEGLTCQDYRVHSIDLSDRGLEGYLGGYLCGFTELRRLDLSHNRLTRVTGGCQQLSHLESMDLSYNLFTGYLPFAAVSMPKLAMLNLSNNGFADYIPNSWGNLTSLEVLDISSNDITGSVPDSMMALDSLRVLALDYNCRVCGQLPNSFTNRVDLGTTGTNIGAWMCWSNSDSCRQSTSFFIAQIGVSIAAIFCFLGACTLYTKFRQRHNSEFPEPVARLPKAKSSANFLECVASLVEMPDGGSQVFVAFPICQELPLFRRNPILEAMRKRDEAAALADSATEAPVPEQLERGDSSAEEVRIQVEGEAGASGSVVALVRMPSMTSTEDSEDDEPWASACEDADDDRARPLSSGSSVDAAQ